VLLLGVMMSIHRHLQHFYIYKGNVFFALLIFYYGDGWGPFVTWVCVAGVAGALIAFYTRRWTLVTITMILLILFTGKAVLFDPIAAYPDFKLKASAPFENAMFRLFTDTTYEHDSLPNPTAYQVFECDPAGVICHFLQMVYREPIIGWDGSRPNLTTIFRTDEARSKLLAVIDGKEYHVRTTP